MLPGPFSFWGRRARVMIYSPTGGPMLEPIPSRAFSALRTAVCGACIVLFAGQVVFAQRTQLKPGWNMFSVQQDIAVGKQNAAQAERLLAFCNAPKVDA